MCVTTQGTYVCDHVTRIYMCVITRRTCPRDKVCVVMYTTRYVIDGDDTLMYT